MCLLVVTKDRNEILPTEEAIGYKIMYNSKSPLYNDYLGLVADDEFVPLIYGTAVNTLKIGRKCNDPSKGYRVMTDYSHVPYVVGYHAFLSLDDAKRMLREMSNRGKSILKVKITNITAYGVQCDWNLNDKETDCVVGCTIELLEEIKLDS